MEIILKQTKERIEKYEKKLLDLELDKKILSNRVLKLEEELKQIKSQELFVAQKVIEEAGKPSKPEEFQEKEQEFVKESFISKNKFYEEYKNSLQDGEMIDISERLDSFEDINKKG